MNSKKIGIAMCAIGIVLLLFTFYLAYNLYEYLLSSSQQATSIPSAPATNSTVSGIVQAVTSSVIGAIPINKYATIFLSILVLYVLANVSYKITKSGIDMMSSAGGNGAEQKPK